MQVNGWVLGLGLAAAIGGIAQAQIAPGSTADNRSMVSPEIATLRNEIAALKAANQSQEAKLKALQSQHSALEAKYNSHRHCAGVGAAFACDAKFKPSA